MLNKKELATDGYIFDGEKNVIPDIPEGQPCLNDFEDACDKGCQDMADDEVENLFFTEKPRNKRGNRRKMDYQKAKRKSTIYTDIIYDHLPLYDNLHQYSKKQDSLFL